MYVGLVIISYVREIPGCNAFHIFYPLVALYFVIQLIYLFTVFDGSVAMLLLLFFLEKIIEILGMAVSEALSIWLIPDYMYYYHPADTVCAEPQCPLGHHGVYPDPRFAV